MLIAINVLTPIYVEVGVGVEVGGGELVIYDMYCIHTVTHVYTHNPPVHTTNYYIHTYIHVYMHITPSYHTPTHAYFSNAGLPHSMNTKLSFLSASIRIAAATKSSHLYIYMYVHMWVYVCGVCG